VATGGVLRRQQPVDVLILSPLFIANVAKSAQEQTAHYQAQTEEQADKQSPALRCFDILCRTIIYGTITIGCGLYTQFDREGLCRHLALSKVIIGIVAWFCSYAAQFIIIARGIEKCIKNEHWKEYVKGHFDLLSAA
jgi:hypothetical protein